MMKRKVPLLAGFPLTQMESPNGWNDRSKRQSPQVCSKYTYSDFEVMGRPEK